MELKKLIEEYQFYLSGKTMKRTHHFKVLDALQGSVRKIRTATYSCSCCASANRVIMCFWKASCRTGSVLTWIWKVRSNLNVRRLTAPADDAFGDL